MSTIETNAEIAYPESDGLPMGETDLHQWWMIRIADWLRWRYHGQRVYVSGNLLVYPFEGNNVRHVSPDCFVVFDCEPGFRRTYKIWEEGKPPDVVVEVTSSSTRRNDEHDKRLHPMDLRVSRAEENDQVMRQIEELCTNVRVEGGVGSRYGDKNGGVDLSREAKVFAAARLVRPVMRRSPGFFGSVAVKLTIKIGLDQHGGSPARDDSALGVNQLTGRNCAMFAFIV